MNALFAWLKPYLIWIEVGLVAFAVAGAFTAGWKVKGWQAQSAELAEKRGRQQALDAFHDHEANVAGILDKKLAELRANETIVEKHFETLVDRPVYRNVCVDADGLRLLESARTGSAPAGAASASLR